jgi:hypothetical protein
VVFRPVGPLPPGAYWFRRLLVLALVIVIALAVWWVFVRDSGDADLAAANTEPSVTETPSQTQTSSSPKPTKTESTQPTAPLCDDGDVAVTVTTNEPTYAAGQEPTFTLTVENISDAKCRRDVGPRALELRVSSGGSKIWSSDDCSPGGAVDERTLLPGDSFEQTVQWSRVVSEPDCPTPQDQASAGDYQVVARNLEIISDPAVFTLE